MRIWLVVLPLLLATTPAWALKPAAHRNLAEQACEANRLPQAFCDRMGKQVYETDYLEWTDLSAHAQRELGQDRCEAADAAASRVEMLARAMVEHAARNDYDSAAIDLGRAMHTLQDECAHHGMTNEEHAFYSLEDTCGDGNLSPDTQPDALACAQARTDRMMAAAAAALQDTSWSGVEELCESPFGGCALASLPSPFQACDFLSMHYDWDGADSRWNGDIVGPALEDAFARGLRGDPVSASVCDAPDAIDPVSPRALTTNLDAGCLLTDVLCLGKADGGSDAQPPAVPESGGGCAAGGSPSLLVALLVLRRRKKRDQN
jgi:hypothetical protein